MMYMENNHPNEVSFTEKMTWHKPQIQQLTINVDTQLFAPGPSSTPDLVADG